MPRFITFFSYTGASAKAMIERPSDRSAAGPGRRRPLGREPAPGSATAGLRACIGRRGRIGVADRISPWAKQSAGSSRPSSTP